MIREIKYWRTDVPSGLVVFLVAIPLCLGIALASGAPALSGIIAGIAGGLIVTLFSNSSLGVSGPAAGLVAIVEPAITQLGFQNFLIAVVFAGIFQFLLGLMNAGTIGYYFPTAVIKGMLVAIGLIIILKQIPHAFGYDKDYEGDLAFKQSDGYNTFTEIGHAFEAITPAAVVISVVCLAILIFWETKFMKEFVFTRVIQGPLVAVVAGVVLFLSFGGSPSASDPDEVAAKDEDGKSWALAREHLVSLPESIEITTPRFDPSKIKAAGSEATDEGSAKQSDPPNTIPLAESSGTPSEPAGDEALARGEGIELIGELAANDRESVSTFRALISIILCGLTLAVVASLESLLCAEATDKLDPQRRQTDLNQELRAQGIGNFVSGLLGGLPVTQVIVRSSTNIQSGAQSRLAAFVHGILLFVCVLAIPNILNMIPLASLAAILFVVGYKLAHPSKFVAIYKLGKTQFLPFMITIVAILRTDLLIGIGIGLIASLFFILKDSYVKSIWMSQSEQNGRKVYRMTLAERVFFINKGHILNALQKIEPGSKLVIDASNTVRIDQDVTDLINDFETHAAFENIEVVRLDFVNQAKKKADPARVRLIDEAAGA